MEPNSGVVRRQLSRFVVVLTCLAVVLAGGAGAATVSSPPTPSAPTDTANSDPVADAGENTTVDEGSAVSISGFQSVDPDGDSLSYEWTQVDGPSVQLNDPDSESTSFTAPSVATNTTLTFELTVRDGNGGSDTDRITVTVAATKNAAPSADAGDDQSVDAGTNVSLDASSSSDPDGDPVSYDWTQTGGPSVSLTDADTATPEFTAPSQDASSRLTFEVNVSDAAGAHDTDTVEVVVGGTGDNTAPSADAGSDLTSPEKSAVELDASGSSDSDGDVLLYDWSQTGGPSVTLVDTDTATPQFTTPNVDGPTDLTFEVTVSDGNGASDTATVTVTVTDDTGNSQFTASRSLSDASVDPGNTTTATVEVDVTTDVSRLAVTENFSPAFEDIALRSVTVNGTSTFPLAQGVNDDQLTVALDSLEAGSTVRVTYEATVGSSPGTQYDVTGDVSSPNGSVALDADRITVESDVLDASRSIGAANVTPGNSTTATVSVSVNRDVSRLAVSENVSPAANDVSLKGVKLNGSSTFPTAQGSSNTGLTVALNDVKAGSTVTVSYEVTVNGTEGTTHALTGQVVTGSGSVTLDRDTINATNDTGPTGPVARADLNDDGEISTSELSTAIGAWTNEQYTTNELNAIITAWVNSS